MTEEPEGFFQLAFRARDWDVIRTSTEVRVVRRTFDGKTETTPNKWDCFNLGVHVISPDGEIISVGVIPRKTVSAYPWFECEQKLT